MAAPAPSATCLSHLPPAVRPTATSPCSCAQLSTTFACSDASISSATSLRQRRRRSRGALYRGATFPQPNGDSQLRSRRSQLEAVPSGKQLLVPAAGPSAWQGLHPHSRPDRAQRTPSAEMQAPLESPPRRCLSMPQGGALTQWRQTLPALCKGLHLWVTLRVALQG